MKKNILVIGSLNMDLVVNVDNMPGVGETVMGRSLAYVHGGKGANQAAAAARLGGAVVMLGCVGRDEFGASQSRSLSVDGVDVSRLKTSQEHPTGTAIICVDGNGDNVIVAVQGANGECGVEYLREHDEAFRDCDFVVLQMEIPYDAVEYAVERASELNKTVILNPAPVSRTLPGGLLRRIDYITPNETELAKLAGINLDEPDAVEEGARRLLAGGVKNVLVTLGDRGVFCAVGDICEIYPAMKVRAVDATAAGDCFNGAFAVALAEGGSVGEAIAFANTAASIAVTRKGAQSSLPLRGEVIRAL